MKNVDLDTLVVIHDKEIPVLGERGRPLGAVGKRETQSSRTHTKRREDSSKGFPFLPAFAEHSPSPSYPHIKCHILNKHT